MIYSIPVLGWTIGLFLHIGMAIPFYYFWNWLAPKYFYWLPSVYLQFGFWEIVGLFVIVSVLKAVLVPRLMSVSNTSAGSSKK